jgi:uncharacterized membrane protein
MEFFLLIAFLIAVIVLMSGLSRAQKEIAALHEKMEGLRRYLYEIDPQFDDERASRKAFDQGEHTLAGYDDCKLKESKQRSGKRTLDSPF